MRFAAATGKAVKPDFVVDRRGRVRTSAAVKAGVVKAGTAKAAATIAACSALVLSGAVQDAGERAVAIAQSAKASVADLINRRSPGLRRWVTLADSKKRARAPRVYRPAPRPRQTALPKKSFQLLAPPPPAVPIRFDTGEIAPGPVLLAGILPNFIPPDEGCLCDWAYIPPSAFGGGLVIGIGGGGGGGILPPGPGPGPRPPAIPEAQTWAMMIAGFAIMGTLWRRRRVIVKMIGSALTLRLEYSPAQVSYGR
jgi:hypothetical protein